MRKIVPLEQYKEQFLGADHSDVFLCAAQELLEYIRGLPLISYEQENTLVQLIIELVKQTAREVGTSVADKFMDDLAKHGIKIKVGTRHD